MPSRARVAGAASTGAAAIRKRFRPPQGRCQKRELRLCDSDHRKGLCDFREHHRSFWLFLPSSENSIGHRCRLRWLPGCCRTGSETAAISVQPLFLRFGYGH
ncbi:uncharacterized protein LOC127746549 isoform X2 [Arachis duranensis]|uniref:Uncharacterized protein LOC127746549 isoform X2 n=1 Tax=Arachis duranensis TaxID=130453 RepID=A0A9C6TSH0_ARADU|nr:uncharacterized protein LOC127746549 isoform X2 [Arachis duranensis]